MIQLPLNKITPHFQLLPMSKVDRSYLRIHEVPPLQYPKSSRIPPTQSIKKTAFSNIWLPNNDNLNTLS